MIYCVVPEEMAGELLGRLRDYYADDPNVTVIVDRRKRDRRGSGEANDGLASSEQRERRDRRRARVAGEFPPIAGE